MAKAIQAKTAYLDDNLSTSDTEVILRWLDDIYGNQVTMTGTIMYFTIDPKSSENQEICSCTNIIPISTTKVRLTGVVRGLSAHPDEVGTPRPHGANVEVILSNNPQFYDKIAFLDEEETITEAWDFEVSPTVPTPTAPDDAVSKDYADNLVNSGAADASETLKGIARLSASPITTLGTATITVASPAVVSLASHGLTVNDSVQFTTSGALPTGLLPSVTYYVIAAGLTSVAFQLSASLGGSAINTTGTQSGVHTLFKTTPVAVGVNDTKMLNQNENDAAAGASGSPSDTNRFETQNDTSNAATKTATTIGFTAGTKTIGDSWNGFVTAWFLQGQSITITGSASNNGTFTIVSVAAGAIVVAESLVTEAAWASVVMTVVTANKLLRMTSTGAYPAGDGSNITNINTLTPIFGTWADGAVIFDGSTTILGLVPAGSIYTMTRDIHCTDITINVGVTIKPAGYRIYATGTTTNNGTISNNWGNWGNAINSSASTIGAAGAAGAAATAGVTVFGTAQAGTIGADGRATSGNGNASSNPSNTTNAVNGIGGAGGAGGDADYSWPGGNPTKTWGAAGTSTAATSGTDGVKDLILALTFYTIAWVVKNGTGGSGGGGGALDYDVAAGTDRSGSGGGGGGAGGVVFIATKNLAGNGAIQANGGAGWNGWNGYHGTGSNNTASAGGGGGGGGAGGTAIVITKTAVNPNTLTASGWAPGSGWTGANNGTGTNTAGASGTVGTTWQSVYFVI